MKKSGWLFLLLAISMVSGCSTIQKESNNGGTDIIQELASNSGFKTQALSSGAYDAQEEVGDVLISYGVVAAQGNGARNRVYFNKRYANDKFAVITSGEHSSEHWFWEKYINGFQIGTDESSRLLYYFAIGIKEGASPSVQNSKKNLDIGAFRIKWGTQYMDGQGTSKTIYFTESDELGFAQYPSIPAIFVSGLHEGHVAAWNYTLGATGFRLVNFSSSPAQRELNWVAIGRGASVTLNTLPALPTFMSDGIQFTPQIIGDSQINFARQSMGQNVMFYFRFSDQNLGSYNSYKQTPAAFADRDHGWDVSPLQVTTTGYQLIQYDAWAPISTFTIGKIR